MLFTLFIFYFHTFLDAMEIQTQRLLSLCHGAPQVLSIGSESPVRGFKTSLPAQRSHLIVPYNSIAVLHCAPLSKTH